MKNLLTLQFWLASRPGELLFSSRIIIGVIILLFVVTGVVFKLYYRKGIKPSYRKIWNSLSAFGFTNAVVGAILLFFSYEMLPVLSARFWYLLWLVEIVLWSRAICKASKEIPKLKEQREADRKLKQYIP